MHLELRVDLGSLCVCVCACIWLSVYIGTVCARSELCVYIRNLVCARAGSNVGTLFVRREETLCVYPVFLCTYSVLCVN